ncbi:hypothetical protein E2320_001274 [Naja naja]|nr:hypothetical protein E2320_001274 [Naja naja]
MRPPSLQGEEAVHGFAREEGKGSFKESAQPVPPWKEICGNREDCGAMAGHGETRQPDLLVASKFLLVALLNLGPAAVVVRRGRTPTCIGDPDQLSVSKIGFKGKRDHFKSKD